MIRASPTPYRQAMISINAKLNKKKKLETFCYFSHSSLAFVENDLHCDWGSENSPFELLVEAVDQQLMLLSISALLTSDTGELALEFLHLILCW